MPFSLPPIIIIVVYGRTSNDIILLTHEHRMNIYGEKSEFIFIFKRDMVLNRMTGFSYKKLMPKDRVLLSTRERIVI